MKAIYPSLLVLAVIASPVRGATAEPTSSAWEFLGLIDKGQYAQSWADGSALFRTRITEKSWESKNQIFRDAVGSILWRDVEGVAVQSDPPDLPKGQYAIVHFRSKFTKKADCEENVILLQEGGLWRVATYTIK